MSKSTDCLHTATHHRFPTISDDSGSHKVFSNYRIVNVKFDECNGNAIFNMVSVFEYFPQNIYRISVMHIICLNLLGKIGLWATWACVYHISIEFNGDCIGFHHIIQNIQIENTAQIVLLLLFFFACRLYEYNYERILLEFQLCEMAIMYGEFTQSKLQCTHNIHNKTWNNQINHKVFTFHSSWETDYMWAKEMYSMSV